VEICSSMVVEEMVKVVVGTCNSMVGPCEYMGVEET
jgi:hypothetical protein